MTAAVDDWHAEHVQRCREIYAVQDAHGEWHCRCGGELSDEEYVCAQCSAKEKAEEELRRRKAWEAGVRESCARTFSKLPDWEHTKSADEFSKVVMDKSLWAVAERWEPSNGSALLLGPSGVGKTSTVIRSLRRLEAERVAARLKDPRSKEADLALSSLSRTVWTSAFDLVRALGTYGNELEARPVQAAAETPLLILDELAPEPAKYSGVLFDLIDRRYAKQLPTIVTSGMTPSEFANRYGDAFLRRLTDQGVGRLVNLHRERNAK